MRRSRKVFQEPAFRVDWMCLHCSGEGGDIVDCRSLSEARRTAKALETENKFETTVMQWDKKKRDWVEVEDNAKGE